MSFQNPDPDTLCDMMRNEVRTIAVVGLSPNASRPSHRIAAALQRLGYRIIPVRPRVREVLGEPAYPDLSSVPQPIDLVNVFRAASHIGPIVDECLRLGLKRLWLQQGIIDEQSARRARDAGMTVVMDLCIMTHYRAHCQ
jgi:predicted CoA-binding protein